MSVNVSAYYISTWFLRCFCSGLMRYAMRFRYGIIDNRLGDNYLGAGTGIWIWMVGLVLGYGLLLLFLMWLRQQRRTSRCCWKWDRVQLGPGCRQVSTRLFVASKGCCRSLLPHSALSAVVLLFFPVLYPKSPYVYHSFDNMDLKPELLRGIYAYG